MKLSFRMHFFQFASKQLERESKRCEKEQKVQQNKVKKVSYLLIWDCYNIDEV